MVSACLLDGLFCRRFSGRLVLQRIGFLPDGFFAELPPIQSRVLGPWNLWQVSVPKVRGNARQFERGVLKFEFLLGNEFGRFAASEWARCAVVLEQNLHERILHSVGLKNLSGNRRFFKLDSSDGLSAERTMAINVSAGDLTLDLGDFSVRSFMANVEGDVKIRGNVHFDTLRIYATGSVSVQGNVAADFAEIFGLASVTVSGNVSLAGSLLSKQNIEISDRAQMKFPSVALAVGYRENRLSLLEKSVFEGLAIAPSGTIERDSSAKLLDSTQVLLPFCKDTRNVVFSRRRL